MIGNSVPTFFIISTHERARQRGGLIVCVALEIAARSASRRVLAKESSLSKRPEQELICADLAFHT